MGHLAIELLIIPSVMTVLFTLTLAATWKSVIWAFGNPSAPGSRRS